MRPNLEIAGLGHALPQRIVDNDEVARVIDTSDAFIRTRTGVRHRRYLAPGQQLADLACPAAERAMAEAGVAPADIDLLIVNTLSPDHHDPSQACYMQPRLGLREIPCFDIRAQCSGGLYGIEIARHFVASGLYRNVLLICAEALSRRIDTSNAGRNLSILLSDGAAAMVLYEDAAGRTLSFYIRPPESANRLLAAGERPDGALLARYGSARGFNYAVVGRADSVGEAAVARALEVEGRS